MPPLDRRQWLTTGLLTPLLGGLAVGPADSAQRPRRFAAPLSGPEIMRNRYFPNVPLVTHSGAHVRFYDDLIKNKVVVLNFMYADCEGVCPLITANLAKAKALLEARTPHSFFIYSITLKPGEDTPRKLEAYAAMHGAGKNWLFLTGSPGVIEQLRRTLGYVDLNPAVDRDTSQHSGMIRYGNEPLALWGACQGSARPEWIAEEISFVLPDRQPHEHQTSA